MPTEPRVVIPLRSLDAGKSRLSGMLTVAERQALIDAMLCDVLAALQAAGMTDVVVTTRGAHAAEVAAACGVPYLTDPNDGSGPNGALMQACDRTSDTTRTVMIVAADLPRLTPDDVAAVVACDADVVVCPTHDGGTAVLRLPIPRRFGFAYGPQSASQHVTAAETSGLTVAVLTRDGCLADLDTPEDFDGLTAGMPAAATLGVNTRRWMMSRGRRDTATLPPPKV